MGDMTKNFSRHEFMCNDGSDIPSEYEDNLLKLVKNLQVLRDHIKTPLSINSAYRSPDYNAKIGGAPRSKHMLAMAADLSSRLDPRYLASTIEQLIAEGKMDQGGIGIYSTFVHYDVRDRKARW